MRYRTPLLSLLPVLALAAAAYADPQGPAIGTNRYKAAIASATSEPDVDDYVGSLIAGERLTVTVQAAAKLTLRPRITLIAPDGAEIVPSIVSMSGGRGAALKSFAIPTTGRWAVRVAGEGDTQGAYAVTFKIAAARATSVNAVVPGGANGTSVPFEGIEGASLDLKLTWKSGVAPVTLVSVGTPYGPGLVPANAKTTPTSITLKRFTLAGGDGTYSLRLAGVSQATACRVDVRVTPQGRPSGRPVVLSATEPTLDAVSAPIDGVAGVHVHLLGSNFSTVDPPKVYFGNERAISTVVAGGAEIDAIAPSMADGATVDVAVVAKDGQAAVREGYFRYMPLPSLIGLVSAYDATITGGRAAGGDQLVLKGTGFAAGQTVRFGATPATIVSIQGTTRIELVVPAGAGSVPVYVVDAYGRAARSSFLYDYKSAPGIDLDPYSPDYGAVAGGTVITMSGYGFEPTDRLAIDGVATSITWLDSTTIRFVSPARPAGTYAVTLLDRFDAASSVPDFQVKAAPQVASVVAMNGPTSNPIEIDSAGGTMVQVTGAAFTASDTITLGGMTVAIATVSDGVITFVAPAGSPGLVDLVVIDAAGQKTTIFGALRFVTPPPPLPPSDS